MDLEFPSPAYIQECLHFLGVDEAQLRSRGVSQDMVRRVLAMDWVTKTTAAQIIHYETEQQKESMQLLPPPAPGKVKRFVSRFASPADAQPPTTNATIQTASTAFL